MVHKKASKSTRTSPNRWTSQASQGYVEHSINRHHTHPYTSIHIYTLNILNTLYIDIYIYIDVYIYIHIYIYTKLCTTLYTNIATVCLWPWPAVQGDPFAEEEVEEPEEEEDDEAQWCPHGPTGTHKISHFNSGLGLRSFEPSRLAKNQLSLVPMMCLIHSHASFICLQCVMLVGGLEHFLFSHILGIMIPID